ncbi:MAG: hypothetical protein IJ148_06235 [Bacteroidaceae bacterium]|nr:hypothetical protein [Bacteroidaceae bacterium]
MKKKSFLLTMALLCTTAQGAWSQSEVGTEAELTTTVASGGSVRLTADITLSSRLEIASGTTVSLDLNGHTLQRSLEEAADDGNVIFVAQSSTLTISDGSGSGQITGGWAKEGGGIYNAGTLNIQGGAVTQNKASSQGGGIWSKGTLNISGGTVSHNEAPSTGGIDNTGTLTISGGTVDFNVSTTWGGGGIANHNTMTISGGTVSNNRADNAEGGGLWNEGTLYVKGGKVIANHAQTEGGGIWNQGRLKMEGSIYVWNNFKNPTTQNNVFLSNEKVIDVSDALTGSNIGVTLAQPGHVFTSGYTSQNPSAAVDDFFHSDNSAYSILERGNELAITFYYNVRSWDDAAQQVVTTQTPCPESTAIEGNHPDDWCTLSDGYYVVSGNANYKVLNVYGSDVHLILPDNTTLNCNHIKLEDGHSLSIYSQSDDDKQGKLMADNRLKPKYDEGVFPYAAAIGAASNLYMGNLFIHGGNIEARCCESYTRQAKEQGAGIGGGKYRGIGKNNSLVVYGGNVTAIGSYYGAGIGGGGGDDYTKETGDQGGPVIIYGGSVNAKGSYYGAGIGGGKDGNGGVVKIYGGQVRATGGNGNANYGYSGAGIGGGDSGFGGQVYIYGGETYAYGGNDAAGIGGEFVYNGGSFEMHGGYLFASGCNTGRYSAPAIGGGYSGSGGSAAIYGGTICAVKKGDYCALIGGGKNGQKNGDLTVSEGLKVSWGTQADAISDTKYQTLRTGVELGLPLVKSADQRQAAIQNRSYTCVLIEPCDHQGTGSTYTYADDDYHNVTCKVCGYTGLEAHSYDGDNPCACGKPYDAAADLWTVMLHRATGAASTSYADRVPMKVVKGQPLVVAAVSGTEGLRLLGYVEADEENAPTGIMMLESEKSSLIKVGDQLTPTADMHLFARYGYVFKSEWTWADDASSASVTLSHAALSPVTLSSTDGKVTVTPMEEKDDAGNVVGKHYTAACTYTLNGFEYTFTDNYQHPNVSLMDYADNSEALTSTDGKIVNVILEGRTLYNDDSWNTLCLPFNLTTLAGTPLAGAMLKALESSSFADGTLTLNFTDASSIEAGMPYLVKLSSGNDIDSPLFTDVTISNALHTVVTSSIDFAGAFSPVSLQADDRSVLYLGADNTLYYPSEAMTIGSCRAYFRLNGITAGDLAQGVKSIVLDFGDEDPTSIKELRTKDEASDGAWYSIDGRRLSGKPATRGVYVTGGKKVAVK